MRDILDIAPRVDTPTPSRGAASASFSELSPQVQQDFRRRLAALALIYSCVYFVVFSYYWLRAIRHHEPGPDVSSIVISGVAIAYGIFVHLKARHGKTPPVSLPNIAVMFEVIAALGIAASSWGWENDADRQMRRVWSVLSPESVAEAVVDSAGESGEPASPDDAASASERTSAPERDDYQLSFVEPLNRAEVRLGPLGGISWVATWILVYPFMMPMPPRRTFVAAFLAATTLPVMMLASAISNGVPPSVQPWLRSYVVDFSVPTYICAGMAVAGARFMYRLTHDLSRAQRMGSYRLVEKIGTGGMGEVWKAEHHFLARPAAIKLIRPAAMGATDGSGGRTARKRFEREAQATATLSSPHTIALFDFGATEDGVFYYVMELLNGLDLKTLVEKHGPLPADRVCHLLRQATHSLHEAHLSGLIHRDIKPANIFTCRCGADYDFVKVLDFGLVKDVQDWRRDRTQLTVEGIASGTPAFMAPEMAYGDREIDGRADIYALGCVAYWLLTGHLVFEGGTPMAILLQHVQADPPPPSTRSELKIPTDLERVILDCLEKDPERRIQSAGDLRRRLAECESALPRLWSEERAQRWWETYEPGLAARGAPGALAEPEEIPPC